MAQDFLLGNLKREVVLDAIGPYDASVGTLESSELYYANFFKSLDEQWNGFFSPLRVNAADVYYMRTGYAFFGDAPEKLAQFVTFPSKGNAVKLVFAINQNVLAHIVRIF